MMPSLPWFGFLTLFGLPWFGFLTLFGLPCMLLPCEGVVYPPLSGSKMTFLPGSTEEIEWTFDDNITAGTIRTWSFARTGSSKPKVLALLFGNGSAVIQTTSGDPEIAVKKPATLVLKNINEGYDGKYTLEVSATFKTDSEVVVFVAEKPNVTWNCSCPITLNEGDDFTCPCIDEDGNPPANVTWFKDGVKFTDVRTKMQTLNLLNVTRADNGVYKCLAISYRHKNYTDEKSCNVTVYFPPANTAITFSKNPAVIKKSVNVLCKSDGFPEPSYAIFHNGSKVNSTGNLYVIYHVTWNDTGTYKCIASNSLGNDFHSDFLNVTEELGQLVTTTETMKSTNPAVTTTFIIISTTTCIPTCTPTTTTMTTPSPSTGVGSENKQEDACSGTEWYIIVVTLVSGIVIGIIFSYIVFRVRKKRKPQPPKSRVDSTYQELDLTKMKQEDNYQSLRVNAALRNDGVDKESNYAELNKTRDIENNYQSLT